MIAAVPLGLVINERYQLEAPLGGGGFGRLFRARDLQRDGQVVALKFADVGGDRALCREAQWLHLLRHPGVVHIYPCQAAPPYVYSRASVLGEQPFFFVMEYLGGGTVESRTEQIGRCSGAWRWELCYRLLLSVYFLHLHRCAHRDLKPQNVVFRAPPQPGVAPQPVCVDFGVMMRVGEAVPPPEVRNARSIYCAPPERLLRGWGMNERLPSDDPLKEDIWSLGVVLYYILTAGRYPFAGEAVDSYTAAVMQGEPATLGEEWAAYARLEELLRRMLSPAPAARPSIRAVLKAWELIVPPPRLI